MRVIYGGKRDREHVLGGAHGVLLLLVVVQRLLVLLRRIKLGKLWLLWLILKAVLWRDIRRAQRRSSSMECLHLMQRLLLKDQG